MRSYLLSVTLCVAMACAPDPDVAGTYQLRGVSGEALPVWASEHPRGASEIIAGSLILNPDGSYQRRLLLRVQYDTLRYTDSLVERGRYTHDAGAIVLQTGAGDMDARLVGADLTIDLHGWLYQYHRLAADHGASGVAQPPNPANAADRRVRF